MDLSLKFLLFQIMKFITGQGDVFVIIKVLLPEASPLTGEDFALFWILPSELAEQNPHESWVMPTGCNTFSRYVVFHLSSDWSVDGYIALSHRTSQSEERINTLLNDHQNELSSVFRPPKQKNKQTNKQTNRQSNRWNFNADMPW